MGVAAKDKSIRVGCAVLNSLPEFLDFKFVGKTILVVRKKFGLFGQSTQAVSQEADTVIF